jgi:hypothetical protein
MCSYRLWYQTKRNGLLLINKAITTAIGNSGMQEKVNVRYYKKILNYRQFSFYGNRNFLFNIWLSSGTKR